MAHIIVVGNEKGGSGKSTVSMHVSVALARMGKRVGVMDLDLRQLSLGRYIENRTAWMGRNGYDLPSPRFLPLPDIAADAIPDWREPA
jgi:chromosome partitioning protein